MANNPKHMDNLKPFTKGDIRCNRKGRPKSFDAWRKLNSDILSELAVDKDGELIVIETVSIVQSGKNKGERAVEQHYATNAEMLVRGAVEKGNNALLTEAAYGKVPQKTEIKGEIQHQVSWKEFVKLGEDE